MHELLISEKQKCIKIVLIRFSAEESKQPYRISESKWNFWEACIVGKKYCMVKCLQKKTLLMGPLIVFNHNSFIFGIFEKVYNFIN